MWARGVEGEAPLQPGCGIAQGHGSGGVGQFMHGEGDEHNPGHRDNPARIAQTAKRACPGEQAVEYQRTHHPYADLLVPAE